MPVMPPSQRGHRCSKTLRRRRSDYASSQKISLAPSGSRRGSRGTEQGAMGRRSGVTTDRRFAGLSISSERRGIGERRPTPFARSLRSARVSTQRFPEVADSIASPGIATSGASPKRARSTSCSNGVSPLIASRTSSTNEPQPLPLSIASLGQILRRCSIRELPVAPYGFPPIRSGIERQLHEASYGVDIELAHHLGAVHLDGFLANP